MSRILFIRSNSVNPDPRVEKSAYALGKNGFEVEILSWDRSSKMEKNENKGFYTIKRIRLKAPYGELELIIKLFFWFFYEIFYLIRADFDILHACDFDTLLPALIISKIRKKTLVYDSFDFYADSLPESTPYFFRKIIAEMEIFLSNFADLIIIADESRKYQFKNKYNKKTIVINNSPIDEYDLHSQNHISKQSTSFTIFYAGIINRSRGLNQIVKAVGDIKGLRLLIAGYDADKDGLINKISNANNVKFLGKLSYDEVIKYTFEADLLFALYDPIIPNHKYSSPNKLFEAMMCGKPIIVSNNTKMANIVKKSNCGIAIQYNNIDHLRKSIVTLKNNPNLCKKLGKNGRQVYEDKFSWEIMERRLIESYQSLDNQIDKNEKKS